MNSPKLKITTLALTVLFLSTGAHSSCGGEAGPPPPAGERSWESRVENWLDGQYCEYAYESEYYEENASYEPHDFGAWEPKFQPSPEYRSQLACKQAECIWVDCFGSEMSVSGQNGGTANPEKMCNNFQGPWKDKCEFDHFVPGAINFTGFEETCGFVYPECPDAATNNCFCGDEAKEAFYADWCDGDMGNWCPGTYQHNDGRTQPCAINGFTFSPQDETVNGTWHPNGFERCSAN